MILNSPSTAQEFYKWPDNSPVLDCPIASSVPFTGFNIKGILRKNNFSDVPDGEKAITNILTNAFGVPYTYADLSVINGIRFTEFNRQRDYRRLYGDKTTGANSIVEKDATKIRDNTTNLDQTAIPLQTIANKLANINDFLGSPSAFQGGDGLVGKYYAWETIYGTADEISSTTGGTFVTNQADYGSPNTYVLPEASESFFAYDGTDLTGKQSLEVTKDWENGLFDFGAGGLHPNSISATGVVQYKGYFNPGTFIETKISGVGGITSGGIEDSGRLHIVEDASGFVVDENTEIAKTTIPVIWKFWELDSAGDRLSDIPTVTARFAPITGDSPGVNVYSFKNPTTGIAVNDKLDSPDGNSNLSTTKFGKVIPIAPRVDSHQSPNSNSPKVLVDFKKNTFYETELYFILSPRVSNLLGGIRKTVYLAGFDRTNAGLKSLPRERFFSENPLKSATKGAFSTFLQNSIPISGSQFDASPKAHIKAFGEPSLSEGNNGGGSYRSIISNKRIRVTYKPPKVWSDIDKGTFDTTKYRTQRDAGTVFHNTAPQDMNPDDLDVGVGNDGNLIIDDDSPNLGPFDTFTYLIDKTGFSVPQLSKTTIRTKDRVNLRAIEHRGLKGYGKGSLKLLSNSGINQQNSVYLSPNFYFGESPSTNDIIVFENYNNTPFVRVSDTKGPAVAKHFPNGAMMVSTLSKSNSLFSNTIPFNSPAGSLYHTHHGVVGDEKYFVYHFRGITDKSLDGFCSSTSSITGSEVFQAIVDVEAPMGSNCPQIAKDTLFSFDGNLITNADEPKASGGLLGRFADYNGDTEPNDTIIRKALDGRLPSQIVLSSFGPASLGGGGFDTPDGTYILDQFGCSPTTHIEQAFIDVAAYQGAIGNHYYRKEGAGNSPFRIVFNSSSSKWQVVAPTGGHPPDYTKIANANVRAEATGTEYSPPTTGAWGTYPGNTNAGSLTVTPTTTAERNRYTLILTNPNSPSGGGIYDPGEGGRPEGQGSYSPQPLIQVLKEGFGITITNSPAKAKVQYQCFPPTDTAPPFRATDTGLRTLPDNVNVGKLNRLLNRYASPEATLKHNTPFTSIKIGRLTLTGDYSNSPLTAPVTNTGRADVGTGYGSKVSLGSGTHAYNRKIKFIYKNKNNVNQTFSILATTDKSRDV